MLTHPLGGALHRLVPHQQLLRRFLACRQLQRAPKAQGFQQGDDRDRATQLSGDWGAGSQPVPCLQSHQPPVGRSRTGSILGSIREGWSCSPVSVSPLRQTSQMEMPPLSHLLIPVGGRESPQDRAAVPARWARPQASGAPTAGRTLAAQPELQRPPRQADGGHLRPPNSAPGAWLGRCWFGRCPWSSALLHRCPAVLPRPHR